jgi:hypothetical protein
MTTITGVLINKDNKKLLKNADSVSFRLDHDGNSLIECNKKIKVDGFETEVRESIPVGTYLTIYESRDTTYEIEKGFYWLSYSKNDMLWQTIVKNLKNDDEVSLEWIAGNNSNVLDENNLSCDHLNLRIKRKDKLEMIFQIGQSITYKDSSARMIKLRKTY